MNLSALKRLLIDNYGICCLFDNGTDCIAPPSPFNTCKVVANLVVIISRINSKLPAMRRMFSTTVNTTQNTLLLNLAVADFLMGVYLLAIGIADGKFGDEYFLFALSWRKGVLCKIIGFIGLVSNVTSVLTLTFVSIERFLSIVFSFNMYRFGWKLTVKICVTIWVVAISMALTPIILSEFFADIFGFSDICLGLPFVPVPEAKQDLLKVSYNPYWGYFNVTQERSDVKGIQWVYSQIVYIYFSSTCVIVISLCYVAMFTSAILSTGISGRHRDNKQELKMALKMSIIVGTDLLCWLPIIILGIGSAADVRISVDFYVWIAVFVMPINSALNPFIYTIPTMKSRKKNEPSFIAKQREQ
ncbi:hypothetical protein HOLleu_21538 [Holothuria leucospilota]|uniref:G-protein coupled receptors family 1 profile domain-containing protein n=1 Tax=Holothuria leucospilota TaxID=206669 RepID=A0A9Q1BWJ4_HOLLE|nr:hypothetical protein HOLleu_21538 [Holothuria leucospilota]